MASNWLLRVGMGVGIGVWLISGVEARKSRAASAETTRSQEALTSSSAQSLSRSDSEFVQQATRGDLLAIAMSRLALQKARSVEVQSMARRILQDHEKAQQELQELARKKGVALPKQMGTRYEQAFERLKAGKPKGFDPAYAREMVKGNKVALKEFRAELGRIQDADLKQWIERMIPLLEAHLAMGVAIVGDEESQAKDTETSKP